MGPLKQSAWAALLFLLGLSNNSRTTDSPAAAKSVAFLFCLVPHLAACALLNTGHAQETYTIRPAAGHDVVLFVEKTGLLAGKKHQFVFTEYSGSLQYVRDHSERSSVQFTVKVKSLQVKDDWIKEKDRSKIHDFALSDKMLDSERFSELTFVSSKIVPGADPMHFRADGSLTVHGETRPVTVMVSVMAEATSGNLLVDGSSSFRLSDFHLTRPSAALGAVGTKDEVVTTFRLLSSPKARH